MSTSDFDLRVHFPASNVFRMLVWSTYYDGRHVVLSRTESGINKALDHVLKNNRDLPKVEGLYIIQTGSPPGDILDQVREDNRLRALEDFKFFVTYEWSNAKKHGFKLPPYIVACPCKGKGCDECEGYAFQVKDPAMLERAFDVGYSEWATKTHRKTSGQTYPLESDVLSRLDLMVAEGEFGHHHQGVRLRPVKTDNVFDRPLFFYRVLETLPIPNQVGQAEKELKKKELRDQQEAKAFRKARKEEERLLIIDRTQFLNRIFQS